MARKDEGKVPLLEWDSWFDSGGSKSLRREFLWLLRHGCWTGARNTRPLMFGAGRYWHDGPIWFLHLGWWSISLEAPTK